jgi:nitrate reductase gamma subunit
MTLLDIARGPALQGALAIFALGVMWRLVSLLLLPWSKDKSEVRPDAPPALVAAARGFVRHMWPAAPYARRTLLTTLNGYVFHLGLAVVVFGFAQHILFIEGLTGLSWPHLPTGVISAVAVITLASLFAALARRISNPVTRLISTFNDYLSWLVTTLPVVTGLIAVGHFWEPYETLLAIHILSVAALLVWFPFGKLMHAFLVFLTRSETGIFYSRRGVEI